MFGLLQNIQKTINGNNEQVAADESATNSNDSNESVESKNESSTFREVSNNASVFAGKLANYAKRASDFTHKQAETIYNTLNDNTIIGELNRQNQSFKHEILNKNKTSPDDVVLPWEGMPNLDVFRKHVLGLSLDEKNFLTEAPPDEISPPDHKLIASKLLEIDSRLGDMRYKLVPKRLTEEQFWKNYFYRISIVKKLIMEKQSTGEANIDLADQSTSNAKESADNVPETALKDNEHSYDVTPNDGMSEEDWEKELLKDISEFELVDQSGQKSDTEWDAEIKAMIDAEIKDSSSKEPEEKL